MTTHVLDCAAVDERLADYLEGDLDFAARREVDAHVASCGRCAALVRDLELIRASAAELPELIPSTDLWGGIARRIDTPVLPLTRPTPNVVTGRRNFDWVRRAAVAAALVAVTAGVTYTLTVAHGARAAAPTVAATTNSRMLPDSSISARSDSTGRSLVAGTSAAPGTTDTPLANPQDAQPVTPRPQRLVNAPAAETYSREIDRLRTIFARNRSQLDPRTAAIIEANLKVIDDAIAQSKAALAQDPASRFLNNQLNIALDKKLELLRTAAQLPSRT